MPVDTIVHSLEIAAERAGDITPAIYEAYFARCQGSADLMRYVDQYMRGRMLNSLFELLMTQESSDQLTYLHFEAKSHISFGVQPHMYENLLTAVRDTVRAACGNDWTPTMSTAWNSRIAVILQKIESFLEPTAPPRTADAQ